MPNSTLTAVPQPVESTTDPLTELLRSGARELIAQAVEAELQTLLDQHAETRLPDGRQAVVRYGHLPERTVQTGLGDVEVRVSKVRDRSGAGIRFNSSLLPPYLKRAWSVEELLPWLYLKGISTGDFQDALAALLGDQSKDCRPIQSPVSSTNGSKSISNGGSGIWRTHVMFTGGLTAFTAMYAWMTASACW